MQEGKDRLTPGADLFKSAADPKIAARRCQAFFEDQDRFLRPPCVLVYLGQIQIELRVIVPHPDRFLAKHLRVAKALLGEGGEQPGVGKVEGILRRDPQRPPGVQQSFLGVPVTKVPQTLLEIRHPGVGGRCCSDPIRHGTLLPRIA